MHFFIYYEIGVPITFIKINWFSKFEKKVNEIFATNFKWGGE